MSNEPIKKPRVVFAFVEAGMGHIMPLRAAMDAFAQRYGDKAEIVPVNFFRDSGDPDMRFIEDDLIKEVKLHNKYRIRGTLQFLLMRLVGGAYSIRFLHKVIYKRGLAKSLEYLKDLKPDIVVNTHFSTLWYACEARARGMINAKVVAYCPDPVLGMQWDARADLIALSSRAGREKARGSKQFSATPLLNVPFFLRGEIKNCAESKEYYRRELGLPEDNFTILLCDGAYGAGKLEKTVYKLFDRGGESGKKLTVIAVCGKNEPLYKRFQGLTPPQNITFAPYGFTDKMAVLTAAADLYMGKSGASNLAEAEALGVPSVITFCATPIEKWIAARYTDELKCALKITNIDRAVRLALAWAADPERAEKYIPKRSLGQTPSGPDLFADAVMSGL
ncbi:MAG: hypothetical protein LBP26_00885 [Clostridiales bacterium]|jgi:UDP-N-acetylglucosamine:LPS N-acetylglucosamine transferase|nr:hypothetical protein [Clostridiales bacterium]